jgi:hypothetical protein
MSTINTNGIDVNYPIPGQNNSTQGFRNNFAAIKQNLNLASSEITDLQNKVVLKSALANSTLNNDMANTLISNASTLGFRATTYNLGNAITGTVTVDLTLGDMQYGNLAGNIFLDFGSWAPTNTVSNVTLQLGRPNNSADFSITFPTEAQFSENYGWNLVENSADANGLATLTFPYDCTQLNLLITTVDCGNTLYVQPINRPFQTTQIQKRTPPSTGQLGDVVGTTCVDSVSSQQLLITSSTSADYFVTANTATLYTGMPVVFTGTSFESNVFVGPTYYVGDIPNTTHFTISTYSNSAVNIPLTGGTGNLFLNPVGYLYVAVDNYSSNTSSKNISNTTAPNIITISSTVTGIELNSPIIFTGVGAVNANISTDAVYYIKSLSGQDITISKTLYNGIAGPEFDGITTANDSPLLMDATIYDGSDIFRRVPLLPGIDETQSVSAVNVYVANNLTVAGSVTIDDNLTINGNLDVNGFVVDTLNANNINTVNLTTTGTFAASTLFGNVEAININVSGIANIPTVNDIRIGGGLNGYYLVTDGTGNLSWVSGGGSGNGVVAGSNTQLQFNNGGSFGAAAGLTFDSLTNVFNAPGNIITPANISAGNINTSGVLQVTGNANIGNIGTSGIVVATGNISGGNLTTAGALSVTGNANVGNIGASSGVFTTIAGTLTTNAQPNITSVGSLTSLTVVGNTTANNFITNNYVIVSVNNSISASGTTQGTATLLSKSINIVTSGIANSGVILPVAVPGMRIVVRNSTSNNIYVYPNTGAAIEPTLADFPYTLNATTSMEFFCSQGGSSGQWFTLF